VTAHTISDKTTLVAACDLLTNDFGSEFVILNLRDGVYYGLEDVGASIWRCLQTPVTVGAICDEVVSEYEVTQPRCERDVRAFIAELASHELVEIRELGD